MSDLMLDLDATPAMPMEKPADLYAAVLALDRASSRWTFTPPGGALDAEAEAALLGAAEEVRGILLARHEEPTQAKKKDSPNG